MTSKKDLKREVGKLWLDVRTLSDQLRDAQDESAAFEANAEGWRIEFENAVAESEAKDKELADLRRQLSKAREAFEGLRAALFPPIPGLTFDPNVLHGWRNGIAINSVYAGNAQTPIPAPYDSAQPTKSPSEGEGTREEVSDVPDEVSELTDEHRDWEWDFDKDGGCGLRFRSVDGQWWMNAHSNNALDAPVGTGGWLKAGGPDLGPSFAPYVRVKT